MIRAELTAILCSDEPDGDFSSYRPDNPACFSCALQLIVGVHNEGGGEYYQLTVCTPQWLIENHAEDDVIVGRNYLIVLDYNYPRIVQWLNRYVERCTGETWKTIDEKLSYIASSEFEGYQPYIAD